MTLAQPTNDVETISSHANALLKKEWGIGEPIRLIGVGISNLAPEQLSLWDQTLKVEKDETAEQLDSAIRALRDKFGDAAVHFVDHALHQFHRTRRAGHDAGSQ